MKFTVLTLKSSSVSGIVSVKMANLAVCVSALRTVISPAVSVFHEQARGMFYVGLGALLGGRHI